MNSFGRDPLQVAPSVFTPLYRQKDIVIMNAPTMTLGSSQPTVQYVCGNKVGREVSVAISLRPVRKFPLKVIGSSCLLPHFKTHVYL